MKITLDYEEYLELKEKADLNKKKIQKIRDEYKNKLIDGIKGMHTQLEREYKDEYKIKLSSKLADIRKLCITNSKLGFISINKVFYILLGDNNETN